MFYYLQIKVVINYVGEKKLSPIVQVVTDKYSASIIEIASLKT